jgi:AcrR family transcriptional regulator
MTTTDEHHRPDQGEQPAPAAESGLRERKKAMTRQALEEAALRLFAEQGFERTTVDEIAAACDVSRRTFFRYFASKEEVVAHDKTMEAEEIFELLASRPADEHPLQSLRVVVLSLATEIEDRRDLILTRAKIIAATPSLRAADWEAQREGVDRIVEALDRRFTEPLDPERAYQQRLVVQATLAALNTALERWVAGDGKDDMIALAGQTFDLLASGFETPRDQ